MASPKGNLSNRGEKFASPTSKMPMQDVVNDLWHPEKNPGGYICLGSADNFCVESHFLATGDGFAGSHRLRETLSRFVNRHFKPHEQITKDQVIVTSGTGQATELSGFALCDRGDGVLLARPHYGNYPMDLGHRVEAKIVGVSLGDIDPFSVETVAAYEKALEEAQKQGIRVRVLMLCNPHNPLGRCYTPEVLKAYMKFCQKHNLHLISDEVYALTVWKNPYAPDAPGFTSVLSINPDGLIDRNLTHVLWGMGKDFGACGLRIGCLISQNQDYLRACEANSYFSCPSTLADLATERILSDDVFVDNYIKENRLRLAENYVLTTKFLESHGIPYNKGTNSGLYVWADLFQPIRTQINARQEKTGDSENTLKAIEAKLQETLLKHKIFVASGADFGSDVPGWFRVVFALDKTYLQLGLERMVGAVDAYRRDLEED
ncbi:1-aminocyclopropane-1-carboxylate synthase [Fusarium beomiforme]|uniref:1-aminocyclopropane-1-carboxylate synthase n=1 Tax=Fusarium beomiforme TaxID=44412 RepID=A0A9P5ATM3_9HYPO|nr:1-aminocyclopropane-1-carboxylate synthase [Fusarium beomiforme]